MPAVLRGQQLLQRKRSNYSMTLKNVFVSSQFDGFVFPFREQRQEDEDPLATYSTVNKIKWTQHESVICCLFVDFQATIKYI